MQTVLRNSGLDELATLLQEQHVRKLDVVAPATSIRYQDGQVVLSGTDAELTEDGVTTTDGVYRPTEIFDAGVANKLGIPTAYMRRMRAERVDLLDSNVNGWLQGDTVESVAGEGRTYPNADPRKFLVRAFRGDDNGPGIARAFLSDRYGIIDNLDVLLASLDGVKAANVEASIDGCDLTERRMRVRIVAPEVRAYAPELLAGYRSPFTGESGTDNPVVFAGFEITNSETGSGAFTLTPRLVFRVCRNGMTITKDALRGVHLGAKMDDGIVRWSADTQRRSLELVTARTRDAVATFLDVEYMKQKIAEITDLAARPVQDAAKTVELVAQKLSYSQEQQASILDHFIKGGQLTAGGVMQAVTSVAQTVADAEDAAEMEASALRALELVAA